MDDDRASLLARWAQMLEAHGRPEEVDPRVDALVRQLVGRLADKWTLIVLQLLTEHGELRFTRIARLAAGVSQKMLTQTLRQMERDGFVLRTVHAVVPPRVEYRLTDLGDGLATALCTLWLWSAENADRVEAARAAYDLRQRGAACA
jgi:DNA-binding HxlR family transcriptional regulator